MMTIKNAQRLGLLQPSGALLSQRLHSDSRLKYRTLIHAIRVKNFFAQSRLCVKFSACKSPAKITRLPRRND
jgi:hypothetical protein